MHETQHNLTPSITVKRCSNHGQLSDRNLTRETTRNNCARSDIQDGQVDVSLSTCEECR